MSYLKLFAFLSFFATIHSMNALEWPELDTHNAHFPIQKTILSSIMGRDGEPYIGGKYLGNWFVLNGSQNDQKLQNALPNLRSCLKDGHRLQLKPVGTHNQIANCKQHILYRVLVDGVDQGIIFSLYNKEKLQPVDENTHPNGSQSQATSRRSEELTQSVLRNIGTVRPGFGLRTAGAVSEAEIKRLMQKHSNNPILNEAFNIIEGADLAIAQDKVVLIKGIKSNRRVSVEWDELLQVMRKDRDLITRAAKAINVGDQYERIYRPFVDQLHALGNQGEVLGYSGRKGIDGAIILLREYPCLLNGDIPDHLKNITGKKAISLRIALFYVDYYKNWKLGRQYDLSKLKTFYHGKYFGEDNVAKKLLQQTSFYQGGQFYSPDNGYVKNADLAHTVNASTIHSLNVLPMRNKATNHRKMVFADCSGFAQFIARKFHPNHQMLNNSRQMSYQLAAVYDALMNERQSTQNKFFDVSGKVRALTTAERNKIRQYSRTIQGLSDVYEPVFNPIANLQPGDVIIKRGAGEGHVMIAVEQDSQDPKMVTIVELTGFGESRGYKWRKIKLLSGTGSDACHRVLRIRK